MIFLIVQICHFSSQRIRNKYEEKTYSNFERFDRGDTWTLLTAVHNFPLFWVWEVGRFHATLSFTGPSGVFEKCSQRRHLKHKARVTIVQLEWWGCLQLCSVSVLWVKMAFHLLFCITVCSHRQNHLWGFCCVLLCLYEEDVVSYFQLVQVNWVLYFLMSQVIAWSCV